MTLPPRQRPLARGGPLRRTTGLARSGPLPPGQGLRRTTGLPRATAALARVPGPRSAPRYTGPDRDIVDALNVRDGGVCVCCGQPGTDWDRLIPHHRADKGMGGSTAPDVHRMSRLLLVHASINLAFEDAHGVVLDRYRRYGWKIRRSDDTAAAPVWYGPDRGWWLLDDDGGRHEAEPPPNDG